MSEYYDIYLKRLNRFGNNYQTRRLNQRKAEFEGLLLKSSYRIDINYNDQIHPALFERYKQDETEGLYYLLTRTNVEIPNGYILDIDDQRGSTRPWMVWYLEDLQVSPYNKYFMLKMTHKITWFDREHNKRESQGYLYGQEDNMLRNEIKSRSRMDVLYSENMKLDFIVMPRNQHLEVGNLVIVGEEPYTQHYKVTGFDQQSTPGVYYVSIDPTYDHDLNEIPKKQENESDDDFYWLEGVYNNGD